MANPNIKTANSFLAKPLAQGQLTTTNPTTLYSVPTDIATKVTVATLTNTSTLDVTVSIHMTPTGVGAVASDYAVIASYTLKAKDTIRLAEIIGGIYVAGAKIWATASAGFSVSYNFHGIEIS